MQLPNETKTLLQPKLKAIKRYTRINLGGTMILDPNGEPAPFKDTTKPRTSKYERHIGNKQLAKFTKG